MLAVFSKLDHAIAASRKVIDDYLSQDEHLTQLAANYLMHEPAPCTHGVDNLNSFDPYEYISHRSVEVANTQAANCP